MMGHRTRSSRRVLLLLLATFALAGCSRAYYGLWEKLGKDKLTKAQLEGLLEPWLARRRPLVARKDQLLAELRTSGTPDLAMLAVANRQLKSVVDA